MAPEFYLCPLDQVSSIIALFSPAYSMNYWEMCVKSFKHECEYINVSLYYCQILFYIFQVRLFEKYVSLVSLAFYH